jgi:hypothetical protein
VCRLTHMHQSEGDLLRAIKEYLYILKCQFYSIGLYLFKTMVLIIICKFFSTDLLDRHSISRSARFTMFITALIDRLRLLSMFSSISTLSEGGGGFPCTPRFSVHSFFAVWI